VVNHKPITDKFLNLLGCHTSLIDPAKGGGIYPLTTPFFTKMRRVTKFYKKFYKFKK
jgi:hypothetical protein